MQQNIERLTTELIGLPKRERLEIVRFLLFLDNRSSMMLIPHGKKKSRTGFVPLMREQRSGIDYDEAMQKIEKRFIQ